MKINLVHQQKQAVELLRAEVAELSEQAVHAKRQLSSRKKEILGKHLVILGAFASGVFLVPSLSEKQSEDAPTEAATMSTLSIVNSVLAIWALLRRVDKLNESNAQTEDSTGLA